MSSDGILDARPDALPEAAAQTPVVRPWRDALRVAAKGTALLLGAYAVTLSLVVSVSAANNYPETVPVKYARLTAPVDRKIVLVGGSNFAYGADSAMIEEVTGCHVANTGTNGYLGVRFLLAEVEPHLNPGDIAIVAFEHDNYFKTVEGAAPDQITVVKWQPSALASLTWYQRLRLLKAVPFVAQQKVLRLMGEAYDYVVDGPASGEPSLIQRIESPEGLSPQGDIVAHIGEVWPYEFEDGIDASTLPIDDQVVGVIQAFAERVEARGVHVLMSYTPVMRDYYDRHAEKLEQVHALISAVPSLNPPSPPSRYVFDENMFFDTVYHLNGEGRAVRTRMMLEDLQRSLGDQASCR